MNHNFGGRPQKIDLQKIIKAALELGVANLSMRKVADKLEVSPAALYRYVESIDALLDACIDALCEKFDLPSEELDWQTYLFEVGFVYRRALMSMPGISSYGTKFGPTTPASFKIIDTILGVLIRNGFEPDKAWNAFSLIANFAFCMVQNQENFVELERQNGKGGYKIMRLQSAELDKIPHLALVLSTLSTEPHFPNFEKRYAEQLKCLVSGIAAELK